MIGTSCGSMGNRILSRREMSQKALPFFRSSPALPLPSTSTTRKTPFSTRSIDQVSSKSNLFEFIRLETPCYSSKYNPFRLLRTEKTTVTRTRKTRILSSTRNSNLALSNQFPTPITTYNKIRIFPKQSIHKRIIRSHSTAEAAETPTPKTLRWVAFTTGLPFVGFGFMDNAILIVAGDFIDTSLGVTLGISTLCAAAIGNIVSDLAGIGCAAYIEEFCATTLKLPVPKLSSSQRQLRSVRMASQGGMAIGMTIGCFLGMLPLLFIDANKAEKLREKARLERLYKDVLNEAKSLVEAESTCLYLRVDKDDGLHHKKVGVGILPDYHPSVNGEYLYAMYYVEPHHYDTQKRVSSTKDTLIRMVSSGRLGTPSKTSRPSVVPGDNDATVGVDGPTSTPQKSLTAAHPTRVIPIGKGIVSRAVLTGTTWNIAGNLIEEPDFYPLSIETSSGNIDPEHFRDCAIVPILDGKGRVIAVLEALNKKVDSTDGKDSSAGKKSAILDAGFTNQDVEILMSLASHVSVSLQKIYREEEDGDEEEFGRLRETIRILKEGKGIKRSITRRKSILHTEDDRTSTTDCAAASEAPEYLSKDGNQTTTLFPN